MLPLTDVAAVVSAKSGIASARSDQQPGVSVVVPVFNSEETLALLVSRVENVMRAMDVRFEMILVDDGSHDRSWETIEELGTQHSHMRGIRLLKNFGQHNALLCGIRAATYDVIVTLDDDLQNPPEEIPRLVAKLEEGWDVVYGTPEKQKHGVLRDIASSVTKIALRTAMGIETARNVSAYRALRTYLRQGFEGFGSPFLSIDVLLTWGTNRFTAVTVEHKPRFAGRSHYTISKLFVHAMNMMTGFSTLPLRIASWIGFAFTLLGVGVLTFVLVRYFLDGSTVAGFPFLASILAIFSGAQLFALGVIGEYLARMYVRTLGIPSYLVRQQFDATISGNSEEGG